MSCASLALACSLQSPSEREVFTGAPQSEVGGGGTRATSPSSGGGGTESGANAGEAGSAGAPGGTGGGSSSGGQIHVEPMAGQGGEAPQSSDGLIAHFAFEDTTDVAKNEVFGASDASYHGTWSNPEGLHGKAVGLRNAADATTDWVELPEGLLSGRAEATISVWVRDLSTARSGARLFGFTRGSGEDFYFCPHDETSEKVAGAHLHGRHGSSAFVDLWTTTPLTDKAWHHIAIRWSATKIELFIDGSSAGSADDKGVKPSDLGATSPNWLGRTFDDSAIPLYSEIDELKIFDHSLKSSEIADLYASR